MLVKKNGSKCRQLGGGWLAGWLGDWLAGSVIILPLRGPSCKLRLAISSARLNFSDGPSVAIVGSWDPNSKKIFELAKNIKHKIDYNLR